MNKLEANISLVIITFFAAIQYVFLSGVPDTVSHFSFLCITNLVGFVITLALFFSELFRVDKKQISTGNRDCFKVSRERRTDTGVRNYLLQNCRKSSEWYGAAALYTNGKF